MKTIQILGSGCANCANTYRLVEEVARAKGVAIALSKVEDLASIARMGIISTPGVVVDGQVVHVGGVPSREQVERWLS